jgi:hypothetical protein
MNILNLLLNINFIFIFGESIHFKLLSSLLFNIKSSKTTDTIIIIINFKYVREILQFS